MGLFGPDARKIALAVEAAWPLVPWFVAPYPTSQGLTVWHAAPAAGFLVDVDSEMALGRLGQVWQQVARSQRLHVEGRGNARNFFSIAIQARDRLWYGAHFYGDVYGPVDTDHFI